VSQSPLRRTPRRLLSLSARRRLLHALARGFVALTMRVEVRGRHHLPPGPVLVSPNHLSHLDPVVVAALMDSPPEVVGLSDLKQELIAPIFLLYSVIPVRRDEVDRDVLRNILLALGRKERVLIFPEAHISRTGALEPARSKAGSGSSAHASLSPSLRRSLPRRTLPSRAACNARLSPTS
jgi:1-acyl-sn-glycerol-3-phosphate acyltransferase